MQTNSTHHSQNHKVAIESVTRTPHRHNGVDTLLSAAHMLDNRTPTHIHTQPLPASSPSGSSLLRRARYVSPSREEVDEEEAEKKKLAEQRKKLERRLRMLGEES
ncbi:MAG: hypothetical protein Q9192_009026, partial [Flavoplaca navasiana]